MQGAAPREPHEEQQETHDEKKRADIVEVLEELGFTTSFVLVGEGGRFVEKVPGDCCGGVESD